MTIQEVDARRSQIHPRSITSWLREIFGEGKFNIHHRQHPKCDYNRPVAMTFRNMPCNLVVMRVDEHKDWHHGGRLDPPERPSAAEMQAHVDECEARGCTTQACVKPIHVCMTDVPVELATHPNVQIIPPPI